MSLDRFDLLLSESYKEKKRKLSSDSNAYAHIDEKCCFCNVKITKKDVVFPNKVYESAMYDREFVSHGDCLSYVLKKYPDKNMNDLHGKVIRMRVESLSL